MYACTYVRNTQIKAFTLRPPLPPSPPLHQYLLLKPTTEREPCRPQASYRVGRTNSLLSAWLYSPWPLALLRRCSRAAGRRLCRRLCRPPRSGRARWPLVIVSSPCGNVISVYSGLHARHTYSCRQGLAGHSCVDMCQDPSLASSPSKAALHKQDWVSRQGLSTRRPNAARHAEEWASL